MSTWAAVVVHARGREDFWTCARPHGVEPAAAAVPEWALVSCKAAFAVPAALAWALAGALSTTAIGLAGQTSADVYAIHVFEGATCVRRLLYSRDGDGWEEVHGRAQPWESVLFFDDAPTTGPHGRWPDLLDDDVEAGDVARFEAARRAGDPGAVLDLLRPHSLAWQFRLCTHLGVDPERPHAGWTKPSFWSRVLRRAR